MLVVMLCILPTFVRNVITRRFFCLFRRRCKIYHYPHSHSTAAAFQNGKKTTYSITRCRAYRPKLHDDDDEFFNIYDYNRLYFIIRQHGPAIL
jgi:hypothetical protein